MLTAAVQEISVAQRKLSQKAKFGVVVVALFAAKNRARNTYLKPQ